MANSLSKSLGVSLPATLVYDYPSITSLTQYLASGRQGVVETPKLVTDASHLNSDSHPSFMTNTIFLTHVSRLACPPRGPIAIPDAIARVPLARWNIEAPLIPGERRVHHAAFLEGVELFDMELFAMTAPEASLSDPQHRILLETVFQLLSDQATGSIHGTDTPVFVGVQQMEYGAISAKHQTSVGPYSATAGALSVAAGRVAFIFGLKGPAAAVDSACSSALVALHVARTLIVQEGKRGALTAGVNLLLSPSTFAAASAAGMLSPSARCKTLDAGADGYAR